MARLAFLLLFLSVCVRAQDAGIAGVVVDQTTKQPLRGVHIRMITGDFNNEGGIDAVYGALTDEAGKFSVTGLKAGFFIVLAERAGYTQMPAENSATPVAFVALKAGQQLTDYRIVMAARAIITGHILDEYGDPVAGISVQTEAATKGQGQEVMGSSNSNSDDHGAFRLAVPPGKYYVCARIFSGGQAGELRTDGSSSAPFVTTYYPNATDKSAASPLQVGPGEEVTGIEIRMNRSGAKSAGRGFSISGTVTGIPSEASATVMLSFGESASEFFNTHSTNTLPDGKFSLDSMPAGYYRVNAFLRSGDKTLQSQAVEFHLESADQTGLQLTLYPAEELAGKIEFLGGTPGPATMTVSLEFGGGLNFGNNQGMSSTVAKDGSFRIPNVLMGKYRVHVEPLPENAYLKEISLDGQAAPGGTIDLSRSAGSSRLKITVGLAGGSLSGKVLDKDGQPFAGMAMVFLAKGTTQPGEENSQRVSNGSYNFHGLEPGKYHLVALDMVAIFSAFAGDDENELMKKFIDASDAIEIKDGDRLQKDVTAFTKIPEKK